MIEILFEAPLPAFLLPPACLLILFLLGAAFLIPHAGELPMTRYVLIVLLPAHLVDQRREREVQVVEVDTHRRVLLQLLHVEVFLQVIESQLNLLWCRLVSDSEGLYDHYTRNVYRKSWSWSDEICERLKQG